MRYQMSAFVGPPIRIYIYIYIYIYIVRKIKMFAYRVQLA